MTKRHGPWQVLASREVYQDPWITLRRDEVIRPDGLPGSHCVLSMKPGVTVIALDAEEHVHLTEEFHYAVGRVGLEGASGGLEPNEDPRAAAERELREELGIIAGAWTELGTVDPFTTIIVSPTRMYLAEALSFVPTALEGTEQIRAVRMPLIEALRRVWASEITHGPTCVALLKIAAIRGAQPGYVQPNGVSR